MDKQTVKSGKEIVDDFFSTIAAIESVDVAIANRLAELYAQDKLTDRNVANELQKIRQQNGNEN
ncbi:MAG: hypothetical protein LBE91_01505 [Tannerella sp.]|jgi:hypothetical protein|nr:hypothetical protein [Tannerella sp.]